jgi:hypothetical protein
MYTFVLVAAEPFLNSKSVLHVAGGGEARFAGGATVP